MSRYVACINFVAHLDPRAPSLSLGARRGARARHIGRDDEAEARGIQEAEGEIRSDAAGLEGLPGRRNQ